MRSLKGIYDLRSKDLPMLRRDVHVWEKCKLTQLSALHLGLLLLRGVVTAGVSLV